MNHASLRTHHADALRTTHHAFRITHMHRARAQEVLRNKRENAELKKSTAPALCTAHTHHMHHYALHTAVHHHIPH